MATLVINAHPSAESFCSALAKRYETGAKNAGAKVNLLNIRELDFDATIVDSFHKRTELEPDLIAAQKLITEANHLVFVYPNWWGTYQALLKAFFDRVFISGYAFKYQKNKSLPQKLLVGKSARLIVTMDTPVWYYKMIFKQPGHNAVKKSVLKFCGINPVKISTLSPIKGSTPEKREKWLKTVEHLGEN